MTTMKEVQVSRNLTIDVDELTAFIKEGKLSGYASGIKPTYDPETMIKRLVYRHDPWLYVDEFRGSFMAPGTETVYYSTSQFSMHWYENLTFKENLRHYLAVWQMNYAGGMLPRFWQDAEMSQYTYDILKESLKHPDDDLPLRGPGEGVFKKDGVLIGTYNFGTLINSNILLFDGTETIQLENSFVRQLRNDWPQKGQTRTFRQYISGSIIVYNHQKV